MQFFLPLILASLALIEASPLKENLSLDTKGVKLAPNRPGPKFNARPVIQQQQDEVKGTVVQQRTEQIPQQKVEQVPQVKTLDVPQVPQVKSVEVPQVKDVPQVQDQVQDEQDNQDSHRSRRNAEKVNMHKYDAKGLKSPPIKGQAPAKGYPKGLASASKAAPPVKSVPVVQQKAKSPPVQQRYDVPKSPQQQWQEGR